MEVKSNEHQQPFRGVVVLHEGESDLMSIDITDSNQESFISSRTTESTDPTLTRPRPPIRINVRTEVKRIPLTWEEVSAVLSSGTCSRCWAGSEKEKKFSEAVVSV